MFCHSHGPRDSRATPGTAGTGRHRVVTHRRVMIAALAAVFTAAVLAPAAAAHSPLFFAPKNASPATPLRVDDGTVSIAAYGRLTRASPALHLEVRLAAGAREPLEVLVPAGTASSPSVRVEVKAPGTGWRPVRPLSKPQTFFEPYGRQNYIRTHTGSIGSATGGAFLVRVTLPAKLAGRSVCVATGSREVFAEGVDLSGAQQRIRAWARG
jgi:hypothetical protein